MKENPDHNVVKRWNEAEWISWAEQLNLMTRFYSSGISGEKLEIDPVTSQKASTKFWIRQKPISIDSDHLCACDLVEERSPSEWSFGGGGAALYSCPVLLGTVVLCLPGHAIFKLTYLSNHDYKPLYFESDAATVNEIVLKVSLIGFILRQNIYTTLIGWRIF